MHVKLWFWAAGQCHRVTANRNAVASQVQTRTLLSSEVDAIEKRKEERRLPKPIPMPIKTNRRPTKKWIYDDFGEPLRWVWA